MMSSPCAMLITPITPKVMARPTAASSSTDPSDSPNQTFCSCAHIACVRSISATACCAASAISGSSARCSGVSDRQRVAAAAAGDHARPPRPGRRSARRCRAAPTPAPRRAPGARRDRSRPRAPRSIASSCSGSRGTERLAGGRHPPGRVGVHQRQRRDRRADRPPQRVVDLDRARSSAPPPARAPSPVSGVERLGVRSPPGDPDRPRRRPCARARSPSCSASSTAAARSSPVAPIAATTSARSAKLPSGSSAISSSSVCARPAPRRGRARARGGARQDGASAISGGRGTRGARSAPRATRQFVAPPHSPVATLKFPHDIGARQSAIRSADSGR